MQFSVEIDGLDNLMHYLGGSAISDALQPVLAAAQQRIIQHLQEYPPELPGQTYERTYQLRDGWLALEPTAEKGDVEFGIANPVAYAPYVQRDQSKEAPHQAEIHVGRWLTDQQIVDEEMSAIEMDAVNSLKDIFIGRLYSKTRVG